MEFDRKSDYEQGKSDALLGMPRAIGGTRSGYRSGYDAGLTERIARVVPNVQVMSVRLPAPRKSV